MKAGRRPPAGYIYRIHNPCHSSFTVRLIVALTFVRVDEAHVALDLPGLRELLPAEVAGEPLVGFAVSGFHVVFKVSRVRVQLRTLRAGDGRRSGWRRRMEI